MAYIPGIEHDLFLSYAHEDLEWVSALQEQLTERLLHRLGWECEVWQDRNKLLTGQNLPEALHKAIRTSAAFITVLSRSYQGSEWCEKELGAFLDSVDRESGLETGGYGRVLKVVKFPWRNNAHLGFYSQYLDVPFFDRDTKTGQEREYKDTSERFHKAVDKLSFHIEKLFDAMLRGMEKVFVARTPPKSGKPLFARSVRQDTRSRRRPTGAYREVSIARPCANTSTKPASPSTCWGATSKATPGTRSTSPSRPKRSWCSVWCAATNRPPASSAS